MEKIYFLGWIVFELIYYMKKLYFLTAFGLVLGNFLSTYFGPSLLTWWFVSPVNMAINCTEPIQWAMSNLIVVQMIGTVAGLIIGFAVYFFFFRKKSDPIV